MPTIHLIEGPVGAGKSTFAGHLAERTGAMWLNLDEWMVTLFSADRPATDFVQWYNTRKDRCIEQIWRTTTGLLEKELSVVLELGLVTRDSREAFYQRVDATAWPLQVHLLEVPRAERKRRVQQRNIEQGDTFRMPVSDEVFAMADAAWEAPDILEREDRNITEVDHHTA